VPGKVRDQIRRAEAARKERLARLVGLVRPLAKALQDLRQAQASGVGADQVLLAVDLMAAEAALAEVVEALAAEVER
jgi:hypothetical protein